MQRASGTPTRLFVFDSPFWLNLHQFPFTFPVGANWAGAFSTRGAILIMSSLDFEKRDVLAFETVFHEAMHQWDDQIFDELRGHAQRKVQVPPDLSHAMIFFTAGEAV